MRDILNRKLKDGDLCIGMAIGRHSRGMHIGVFKGSSVVSLEKNYGKDKYYLSKSCTSNTYLIENPTEEELKIQHKILELLDKEEKQRQEKKKIKTIPLGKLEVGGIYKDLSSAYWIYLGNRKITLKGAVELVKEGNCFSYIYACDDESLKECSDQCIKDKILSFSGYKDMDIDVLKGNKKLVKMLRKVELDFPMKSNNANNTYYNGQHYLELIVE